MGAAQLSRRQATPPSLGMIWKSRSQYEDRSQIRTGGFYCHARANHTRAELLGGLPSVTRLGRRCNRTLPLPSRLIAPLSLLRMTTAHAHAGAHHPSSSCATANSTPTAHAHAGEHHPNQAAPALRYFRCGTSMQICSHSPRPSAMRSPRPSATALAPRLTLRNLVSNHTWGLAHQFKHKQARRKRRRQRHLQRMSYIQSKNSSHEAGIPSRQGH